MLYREAGQLKTSYASDMAIFPLREDRALILAILAIAYFVVPFFLTDFWLSAVAIPFFAYAMAAMGLNILTGYCGQLSLGTGGFLATGAYSAYKLTTAFPDLNLVLVFLGAGLCTAIVGLAFGIPSLRVKGFYLAVATLAAQFFIIWLVTRVPWFTNYGASGQIQMPARTVFGYTVTGGAVSGTAQYLFALTFVTLFALIAKNFSRTNTGRAWMAIRDMDIAAELIGIRPLYAKLSAFAVSSFIVGVAGALWAFVYLGSWEPLAFSIDRSLQLLFMIIIGGLGSIMGSFVGAAFILVVPIMLNLAPTELGLPLSTETITHLEFIIFGSLICYLLIKEPRGFARLISIGKEKLRLWPFPY
jgi:branched-chain amino acid transport system permease protein